MGNGKLEILETLKLWDIGALESFHCLPFEGLVVPVADSCNSNCRNMCLTKSVFV